MTLQSMVLFTMLNSSANQPPHLRVKCHVCSEQRLKVEARIRQLEGGNTYRISGTGKQAAKFDKYENKSEEMASPPRPRSLRRKRRRRRRTRSRRRRRRR